MIYRLVTRNSFEGEMFGRASRKLGLEQAILATHDFNSEVRFHCPWKSNTKHALFVVL